MNTMNDWQWEDPEGFTRKKPTREDIERAALASLPPLPARPALGNA